MKRVVDVIRARTFTTTAFALVLLAPACSTETAESELSRASSAAVSEDDDGGVPPSDEDASPPPPPPADDAGTSEPTPPNEPPAEPPPPAPEPPCPPPSPDLDLHADIDICGTARLLARATADASADVCRVGGIDLPLSSSVDLAANVLVRAGARVCLHARLDVEGRVVPPARVELDVLGRASLHVCGHVRAYVAASADVDGALAIGGSPFVVAAGALLDVDADASLALNAAVCVDAELDLQGRIRVGRISTR